MSNNRVVIKGSLKLTSPLQIKTGCTVHVGEEGAVNDVALDYKNNPYIPASSLKGVLRNYLATIAHIEQDRVLDKAIDNIFGHEVRNGEGDISTRLGGKVIFHNLYWQEESIDCIVKVPGSKCEFVFPEHSSTSINDTTGTAERRMLRFDRFVPEGCIFDVLLSGNDLSDDEIKVLLAALGAFNGANSPIKLGGKTGNGNGSAEWTKSGIYKMNEADLKSWALSEGNENWLTYIVNKEFADHGITAKEFDVNDNEISANIEIIFNGPFLISEKPRKANKKQPDHFVRRTKQWDGEPTLSGSSLKGALRAQARKIIKTMVADKKEELDDKLKLVDDIFGSTKAKGLLQFDEFLVKKDTEKIRTQEFVAIDRFSGGAADSAKFNTQYLESPIFSSKVKLKIERQYLSQSGKSKHHTDQPAPHPRIAKKHIGLLALLYKDFVEGDIAIGYGKTKGYGNCTVKLSDKNITAETFIEGTDIAGLTEEDIKIFLGNCIESLERETNNNG